MKQTGGWVIPDNIKWYILIFLLVVLCIIAIDRLFRGSRPKEPFNATEPIKYLNEYTIPEPEQKVDYVISISDRDNGYYIFRDESKVAKKLVRLPYGYYKVNETDMAKIPHGYELEKQGTDPNTDYMTKIVPKTKIAKYAANPASLPGGKPMIIPANGIPDGYYKLDNVNMALLPDGMKPNIKSLGIIADNEAPTSTTLLEEYDVGFVPESTYYSKKYTITTAQGVLNEQMYPPGRTSGANFPSRPVNASSGLTNQDVWPLPPRVYYAIPPDMTNWTPNVVQYLPYGKIPNVNKDGIMIPGYKDDPYLISKTGKFDYGNRNYKDISNNYDQVFHDSIEDLKKQNDMYDLDFGSITVIDKDGNLVTLPRSQVQGDITYYQPGAYTFGASSYVPKYEDSVYLSRTSHLPTMAEYRSAYKKVGFCEADKASPIEIEAKCRALDVNTCASTSCCVLLGGSKCVSGNEKGPTDKTHYSDVLVRNKDSYMHMGKCYGNCP
jgi:hypothetical protein